MDDRCASADLSTSGWYFNANWRYAALISSLLAPGGKSTSGCQAIPNEIQDLISVPPLLFKSMFPNPQKAFLVQYRLIRYHTSFYSLGGNNMKLLGAAFRQTQHFPGSSGCCETWAPWAHGAPWRVPTNGCSKDLENGNGMLPKLQSSTKHLTE